VNDRARAELRLLSRAAPKTEYSSDSKERLSKVLLLSSILREISVKESFVDSN
jgi:hypothetical protein